MEPSNNHQNAELLFQNTSTSNGSGQPLLDMLAMHPDLLKDPLGYVQGRLGSDTSIRFATFRVTPVDAPQDTPIIYQAYAHLADSNNNVASFAGSYGSLDGSATPIQRASSKINATGFGSSVKEAQRYAVLQLAVSLENILRISTASLSSPLSTTASNNASSSNPELVPKMEEVVLEQKPATIAPTVTAPKPEPTWTALPRLALNFFLQTTWKDCIPSTTYKTIPSSTNNSTHCTIIIRQKDNSDVVVGSGEGQGIGQNAAYAVACINMLKSWERSPQGKPLETILPRGLLQAAEKQAKLTTPSQSTSELKNNNFEEHPSVLASMGSVRQTSSYDLPKNEPAKKQDVKAPSEVMKPANKQPVPPVVKAPTNVTRNAPNSVIAPVQQKPSESEVHLVKPFEPIKPEPFVKPNIINNQSVKTDLVSNSAPPTSEDFKSGLFDPRRNESSSSNVMNTVQTNIIESASESSQPPVDPRSPSKPSIDIVETIIPSQSVENTTSDANKPKIALDSQLLTQVQNFVREFDHDSIKTVPALDSSILYDVPLSFQNYVCNFEPVNKAIIECNPCSLLVPFCDPKYDVGLRHNPLVFLIGFLNTALSMQSSSKALLILPSSQDILAIKALNINAICYHDFIKLPFLEDVSYIGCLGDYRSSGLYTLLNKVNSKNKSICVTAFIGSESEYKNFSQYNLAKALDISLPPNDAAPFPIELFLQHNTMTASADDTRDFLRKTCIKTAYHASGWTQDTPFASPTLYLPVNLVEACLKDMMAKSVDDHLHSINVYCILVPNLESENILLRVLQENPDYTGLLNIQANKPNSIFITSSFVKALYLSMTDCALHVLDVGLSEDTYQAETLGYGYVTPRGPMPSACFASYRCLVNKNVTTVFPSPHQRIDTYIPWLLTMGCLHACLEPVLTAAACLLVGLPHCPINDACSPPSTLLKPTPLPSVFIQAHLELQEWQRLNAVQRQPMTENLDGLYHVLKVRQNLLNGLSSRGILTFILENTPAPPGRKFSSKDLQSILNTRSLYWDLIANLIGMTMSSAHTRNHCLLARFDRQTNSLRIASDKLVKAPSFNTNVKDNALFVVKRLAQEVAQGHHIIPAGPLAVLLAPAIHRTDNFKWLFEEVNKETIDALTCFAAALNSVLQSNSKPQNVHHPLMNKGLDLIRSIFSDLKSQQQ